MLRFRDLVLGDEVALRKWPRVIDVVIESASDRLKLKALLENGDHAEAVLQTLELFTSGGSNLEQLDPILRDLQLNSLADAITGERGLARTGLWFDVGQVALNFQGRTKELQDLHQMMIESQDKGRFTPILIAGLGGVGKTSLARKYAYDNWKFYHSNVVLINAESFESLKASFIALAAKIGLQIDSSSSGKEIATKVYEKLRERKICPVLFIFDNVEDKKDFEQFQPHNPIPGTKSAVYVLMTGRQTDVVILEQQKLRLGVLSQNEAVDMIRCQAPYAPLKDVNELAEKLQQLPLALQQALAYIRNEEVNDRTCVRKYLDEYARSEQRLLADGRFREDYEYSHTVMTTWGVTLNKIADANPEAVEIMLMISFVHWTDIGRTKLERWIGDVTKGLRILEKYSMVEINQQQTTTFCSYSYPVIRMHRLLKRVIRMTLTSCDQIRLADRVLGHQPHTTKDKLVVGGTSALTIAITSILMIPFGPFVFIGFSAYLIALFGFAYNEICGLAKMYNILQILKEVQRDFDDGQYTRADEKLKQLSETPGPQLEQRIGLEGGTLENIIRVLKKEVMLKLNGNSIQPVGQTQVGSN